MQTKTDLKAILQRPIPSQDVAAQYKQKYRTYPLLVTGMHADEPLVDISLYGIAGQSYYSRPNSATGDPVKGVPAPILVRKSLAERLAAINYALQNSDEVTELFGEPVELYVNEGYRSPELQHTLYHEVFPRLIRSEYPDYIEEQIAARRDQLIAAPEEEQDGSPSPHSTGAAVDIVLRYAHPELSYVPKAQIPMGRGSTAVSTLATPDYFEIHQGKGGDTNDEQHQRNRRIFYWVMRGALTYDDSGLVVNPSEWWHWSYGDQLWASLRQAPCAFFDRATQA